MFFRITHEDIISGLEMYNFSQLSHPLEDSSDRPNDRLTEPSPWVDFKRRLARFCEDHQQEQDHLRLQLTRREGMALIDQVRMVDRSTVLEAMDQIVEAAMLRIYCQHYPNPFPERLSILTF